jgi:hypothetical protein
MADTVQATGLSVDALDADFTRADIEFEGVDHSGATYEGRVYLNNPDATAETGANEEEGYAGSYYIFGHGGCLGDPGHCDVKPRRPYDPRPQHPLVGIRKVVVATNAVKRAKEAGGEVKVTVVPVVLSTGPKRDLTDAYVKYDAVKIITYR